MPLRVWLMVFCGAFRPSMWATQASLLAFLPVIQGLLQENVNHIDPCPLTTPQVLERLGRFKDDLRPFAVVTVPFPRKEIGQLWTGYFIMPHTAKINDLHGRPMVNIVSGESFHIYDKSSSSLPKPSGWLSLKTMEDEINQILSRSESKFCTPNGSTCTSKTIGLLV